MNDACVRLVPAGQWTAVSTGEKKIGWLRNLNDMEGDNWTF